MTRPPGRSILRTLPDTTRARHLVAVKYNILMRDLVLVVVALLSITGCAGTRMALPGPNETTQAELASLFSRQVDRSRWIPRGDRLDVVIAVDKRVLPAAITVCQRSFNNPQDCPGLLNKRSLVVHVEDERINASVGENYDLNVLGGLVRESGNDDEIALVLAHEYTHALFGHIARSRSNSMWAELAAGLAGLAVIASAGDSLDESQIDTIAMGSTELGREIGWTAFSKDMELEADHLALFILFEAGYDMDKGMQFFQRTLQIQQQYYASGQQRTVGFFETHPSDEERLLRLLSTKNLIEQGATRPTWKQ